jgi:hypothetical protein
MPMRPEDLRAYGSARVVVTTTDGTFAGRLDVANLTDSSVLVLLLDDDGKPDEALALDIDGIVGVSPAES